MSSFMTLANASFFMIFVIIILLKITCTIYKHSDELTLSFKEYYAVLLMAIEPRYVIYYSNSKILPGKESMKKRPQYITNKYIDIIKIFCHYAIM